MLTTVYGAGKVEVSGKISQHFGSKVANKFLVLSISTFSKRCQKFYETLGEHPFTHRERQIRSFLLPAFADNCDVAFIEQEISFDRGEKSYGWLDYWILLNKTELLVETKVSHLSIRRQKLTTDAITGWSHDIRKLKNINRESLASKSKKTNCVNLLIVAAYQSCRKHKEVAYDFNDMIALKKKIASQLKPSPNWSAVWEFNTELSRPVTHENGEIVKYSAVFWFALVD